MDKKISLRDKIEMIEIRDFKPSDYEAANLLWLQTENLCLGEASSSEVIVRYLNRNAGISSVAVYEGKIVGTILAGHDGYRAHIKYLAVKKELRGQGIAKSLIERTFKYLKDEQVKIIYLSVKDEDPRVADFWKMHGFEKYGDHFPNVTLMCAE